jgi:glucosamine--fructose-6-phosphate aminotransferase (isomerizing)
MSSVRDFDDCLVPSTAVLGHIRWATHGEVSLCNFHPRAASTGDFALVHNGIVEN